MEIRFRAVPSLETVSIWPEAAAVLTPALIARFYNAEDIQSRLADARMQLWVAEIDGRVRAACVTEVHNYPRCKALAVILAAGEGFGLWKDWLHDLATCGREMGCDLLISYGARAGWERAAGLTKVGTTYMMDLKGD